MGVNLNEDRWFAVVTTLSPAQVAANTVAERTFGIPNLKAGDLVFGFSKKTAQAGLGISGVRVKSDGVLGVDFSNNTGGAITPTAGDEYRFTVFRPEKSYRDGVPA